MSKKNDPKANVTEKAEPKPPAEKTETPVLEMPPLKDQESILAMRVMGHIPEKLEPVEVERNGEKKIEVLVHFPQEAAADYFAYRRGEQREDMVIIRSVFSNIQWWRGIVHNKHTL